MTQLPNGPAPAGPTEEETQLNPQFVSDDRADEGNRTPVLEPAPLLRLVEHSEDARVQSRLLVGIYLDWVRGVRRLQPSSVRSMSDTLNLLTQLFPQLADITTADIETFMQRTRRQGKPPAAATMARERHHIRGFFRWLHARGVVASDPSAEVGAPKVNNRMPKAIDDEVWKQLWLSAMPAEDRVWLGFGFIAGLRRVEYATMPPSVVHLKTRRLVNLVRKGGSTFPVEYGQMAMVYKRHLPELVPNAESWLNQVEWLAKRREGERFLMPSSTGKSTEVDAGWFNKRLKALLGQAGLPRDMFAPHALRHSCATNLLRCGVPIELIADLLSHSSLDTTRRYLDTSGRLAAWAGVE